MTIEEVSSFETEREPRAPARYPNAKQVFRLFKNYIPVWSVNRQFLTAAQWLYENKGIEELVELFGWYDKHKEEKFCPKFNDPMELVTKYPKLEAHVDRTS